VLAQDGALAVLSFGVSELRGFAGADPGSRMGSNRIFEPGSTPARFEPPDRTRSFCSSF
jgi:hypothetical protein